MTDYKIINYSVTMLSALNIQSVFVAGDWLKQRKYKGVKRDKRVKEMMEVKDFLTYNNTDNNHTVT